MESHKNDKIDLKYTCKICSAQYGRLFALTDHIKSSHPELPEDEVEIAEHYIIEETEEVEQDQVYVVTMACDNV